MIDQSIAAQDQALTEELFEGIDAILDLSEQAMLAVASERRLRNTHIGRWRWDTPEILMSWASVRDKSFIDQEYRDATTIGKNIRVLVKYKQTNVIHILFESNAWLDVRNSNGTLFRHWDHFPVDGISFPSSEHAVNDEQGRIKQHVERAYERVSDTQEVTLHQAIIILPDGKPERLLGPPVAIPAVDQA